MTWPFLYIQRQQYKGQDNWGVLYMSDTNGKWQKLCHSYELPWKEYLSGDLEGKSVIGNSRIKIGAYELKSRVGGPKGWRLELMGTGHRKNIQVHRAHCSMFIEGCILPVHFSGFDDAKITKDDAQIQTQSVALMQKIKTRFDELSRKNKGAALIEISAKMPASQLSSKARVHV